MGRLGFTRDDLNEDERRLYERLGPLFEEKRLRVARGLSSGPLLGKKKMTRLDALREAQRWMIHEGPKLQGGLRGLDASAADVPIGTSEQLPPYDWAAFVLSGDWR